MAAEPALRVRRARASFAAIHDLWSAARPLGGGTARRAPVVIALLLFLERVLAVVAVWTALRSERLQAVAATVALSVVVVSRGALEGVQQARTEAGLYRRVVEAVLRRDVLTASILPDEVAIAALFDGAPAVAGLLSRGLPALAANGAASAVFLVAAILTEPARVVAVSLVAGVGATAALLRLRLGLERAQRGESAAWAQLAEGICHAFDGRLDIVSSGRTDDYVARLDGGVAGWSAAASRAARAARLAGRLPLFGLAAVVGAAVMTDGALRGEDTATIFARGAWLASMWPAFFGIVQGGQDLSRGRRRWEPIARLLEVEAPRRSGGQAPPPPSLVELRDVRFAYDADPSTREALCGVSFAWRAGELLGLAGPNGSGKSTCLRAILGLGRHVRGRIAVDGAPLEGLDVEAWRRSIGFSPQRPYLPPRATVRGALRFLDPALEDEAMIRALDRLGIAETGAGPAAALLDTRVDELSVGQRQRVSLARALCRGARVYVLDEPDADLDAAGVRRLADLLRELARGGMVLFAAHSPELLAAADRVITLREGALAPP